MKGKFCKNDKLLTQIMILTFFIICILSITIDGMTYSDNEFVEIRPEILRWLLYGASPDEYLPDRNCIEFQKEHYYTRLFPRGYFTGNANALMIADTDIPFANGLSEVKEYRLKQSQQTAILKFDSNFFLAPTEVYIIVRYGNRCRRKGKAKVYTILLSKLGNFSYKSEELGGWDYRQLECQCSVDMTSVGLQMHLSECISPSI